MGCGRSVPSIPSILARTCDSSHASGCAHTADSRDPQPLPKASAPDPPPPPPLGRPGYASAKCPRRNQHSAPPAARANSNPRTVTEPSGRPHRCAPSIDASRAIRLASRLIMHLRDAANTDRPATGGVGSPASEVRESNSRNLRAIAQSVETRIGIDKQIYRDASRLASWPGSDTVPGKCPCRFDRLIYIE
jgi:hypothetical protein